MSKTQKVGSSGRFGVRYGPKLKNKISELEKIYRNWQLCPYCHKKKVKRIAAGIWSCRKCKAKFSGRAYEV